MSHSFYYNLKQVLCQGCTQTDKDTLASNEQVWIRGKVYGKASFENNWKIFPLWAFRQWNSACVTTTTRGVGYFRPEWKTLIGLLSCLSLCLYCSSDLEYLEYLEYL